MLKKKRIVVVDDFPGVRTIVKESLEKKGFQVLEASNGNDALKFFDGTQIDLLITDFDMPDMNGASLIKKVRSMTRYTYIPVIMLSGVRKERVDDDIAHLNVACFIQKPFDFKHFYSVIDRLVQTHAER